MLCSMKHSTVARAGRRMLGARQAGAWLHHTTVLPSTPTTRYRHADTHTCRPRPTRDDRRRQQVEAVQAEHSIHDVAPAGAQPVAVAARRGARWGGEGWGEMRGKTALK
jgi:hypothetical protein